MSAATLIADLAQHGTRIVVAGERVRLVHPPGQPPPAALIQAARKAKGDLRAALAAIRDGIPPAYADAFLRLERERPEGASEARWRSAIEDARRFLKAWGAQAQRLGWSDAELFGLHPVAPMARYDVMGLVWLLDGAMVVSLDGKSATIRTRTGATLRRRRRTCSE